MKHVLARYRAQADPLRSERRVELVLLCSGVLVLLLALYLSLRIVLAPRVEPIAPAPDSVRVATLVADGLPPVESREGMLARPLFWPERTPLEAAVLPETPAEASASEKPAPQMKEVTVRGVYGSGEAGGVILSVKQRPLRVAVGEEVDGWRLERVSSDGAVFVSGGVRDERELLPAVIEASATPTGGDADARRDAGDEAPAAAAGEERGLSLGGVR